MGTIVERRRLDIGKGCVMRFMWDESKPAGSIDHNWSEMSYDGAPDSWVPEIGAHWHKEHVEHLEVTTGRATLTVQGKEVILKAGDPVLVVPRGTVHGFKFIKGEPTTLKETAEPAGTYKQEFFEDLFYTGPIEKLSFLQVVRVFYDGDTYIALPGNFRALDQAFTWAVGYLASWIVAGKRVAVDAEGRVVDSAKDK